MSIRTIFIAVGVLAGATSLAHADAATETGELWEALQAASEEAMDSIDTMGDDPAAAALILETKVRKPITTAQLKWWDAMSESEDKAPYFRHMACYNAANTLSEMSGDLVRFLQGRSSRPDVSLDSEYFLDYLGECETSFTEGGAR
ncbi:MAG: hypothetical protein VYB05_21415 [Pseudomonadota bacterium]|nr:hypothetical protein [Pseudomonadota bacterium]